MPKPDDLVIAKRRKILGDLAVRQQLHGLSLEEIAELLYQGRTQTGPDGELELDPSSVSRSPEGKRWSLATIHRDLEWVKDQWRLEALRTTADHRNEILAQYLKLLRIHWNARDYPNVNTILKEIRTLLGADDPRVAMYEQLRIQMDLAAKRLRAEFADEPELLARAFRALAGSEKSPKVLPN